MELGGKVTIDCPKSGYKCELEFKLKVKSQLNTLCCFIKCEESKIDFSCMDLHVLGTVKF